MVGICSLADWFAGEEADSSGIGRNLRRFNSRSGSRLGNGCRCDWGALGRGDWGDGIFGSGVFHGSIFRSFYLFGGRWIEDAISQRSERGLDGRQDLLPTAAGVVAAGVCLS